MNTNNPKRLIIFLTLLALLFLSLAIGINYYFEIKKQGEIKSESVEFINRWANFNDETDAAYLSSIKPFMSPDLYNDTLESAEELKKMTEEGGYEATASKFTIESGPNLKKQKKEYLVTASGQREYVGVEKYKEKIELTWSKIGRDYLITEINAEKI